jgi:hypothetical protein
MFTAKVFTYLNPIRLSFVPHHAKLPDKTQEMTLGDKINI